MRELRKRTVAVSLHADGASLLPELHGELWTSLHLTTFRRELVSGVAGTFPRIRACLSELRPYMWRAVGATEMVLDHSYRALGRCDLEKEASLVVSGCPRRCPGALQPGPARPRRLPLSRPALTLTEHCTTASISGQLHCKYTLVTDTR